MARWQSDGQGGGTLFEGGLPAARARVDLLGTRSLSTPSGQFLGQDVKTATGVLHKSATGMLQGTTRRAGDRLLHSTATGQPDGYTKRNIFGGMSRHDRFDREVLQTRPSAFGGQSFIDLL